jgi:hypothetical protein
MQMIPEFLTGIGLFAECRVQGKQHLNQRMSQTGAAFLIGQRSYMAHIIAYTAAIFRNIQRFSLGIVIGLQHAQGKVLQVAQKKKALFQGLSKDIVSLF